MAKLNVNSLRMPSRASHTQEFTGEDGSVLSLTLRRLDDIENDLARQMADEAVKMYVSGGWQDEDGKTYKEPLPFPAILDESGNPQIVKLNPYTLRWLSRIVVMQQQAPEDRYTLEEFIRIIATMGDQVAEPLITWVSEIQNEPKKKPVTTPTSTDAQTSQDSEALTLTSHTPSSTGSTES